VVAVDRLICAWNNQSTCRRSANGPTAWLLPSVKHCDHRLVKKQIAVSPTGVKTYAVMRRAGGS
jgi:hypothetical protein